MKPNQLADGLEGYQRTVVTNLEFMKKSIQSSGTGAGFATSIKQAKEKSALLTETLGLTIQAEGEGAESPATQAAPDKATHNSPRVAIEQRERRLVIFDLLGTIIDHDRNNALPMLTAILNRLNSGHPGTVAIVTKYDRASALNLCRSAGFSDSIPVYAQGERRGLVEQALEIASPDIAWYFDDSPSNLQKVCGIDTAVLKGRVLGFARDRQSCRQKHLAQRCAELRIGLALSPYDVLHVLAKLNWYEEYCQNHSKFGWTAQDIGFLIPGLNHPFSASGRDAERAIGFPLQEVPDNNWEPIWFNLGWIGSSDSACTLLLRSVKRSLGIDCDLFGGADEAGSMSAAAAKNLHRGDRSRFRDRLERALTLAERGIEEIGIAAEQCRPAGAEFANDNRIRRIRYFLEPLLSVDFQEAVPEPTPLPMPIDPLVRVEALLERLWNSVPIKYKAALRTIRDYNREYGLKPVGDLIEFPSILPPGEPAKLTFLRSLLESVAHDFAQESSRRLVAKTVLDYLPKT
jgi:hypothetical protein